MSTANRYQTVLALLVSAALLTFGLSATWAAGEAAPAATSQALGVQPGTLSGKVLAADGATAQEGVPIKLVNADGEVIAEAITDADGAFQLKELTEGEYTLIVGKSIKGKIVVTEGSEISSLTIKASAELLNSDKPALLAFGQGTGHADPADVTVAGLTPGQTKGLIVAGATTVVVGTATVVAVNNGLGGSDSSGTN